MSEDDPGRIMELVSMKKPDASMTEAAILPGSLSTTVIRMKPKTLAKSEALTTSESPHFFVAGPVNAPCTMAETSPITVNTMPTCVAL